MTKNCRTNHALVSISAKKPELSRGPGCWCLDNKLLENPQYNEKINKTLNEYALKQLHIFSKWETMKIKCKDISQAMSKLVKSSCY